jgi:hypothetical protein
MANINGDNLHAVFADKSSHYGSIRLHSVVRPRCPQDGLDILTEMAKRMASHTQAEGQVAVTLVLGTVVIKR